MNQQSSGGREHDATMHFADLLSRNISTIAEIWIYDCIFFHLT